MIATQIAVGIFARQVEILGKMLMGYSRWGWAILFGQEPNLGRLGVGIWFIILSGRHFFSIGRSMADAGLMQVCSAFEAVAVSVASGGVFAKVLSHLPIASHPWVCRACLRSDVGSALHVRGLGTALFWLKSLCARLID